MEAVVMAWLILAGTLALSIKFLVADLRGRRTEKARPQRVRADERKHQAHEETLRTSRERARIANPELLDRLEAKTTPLGLIGYPSEDKQRIRTALDLIMEEIELLPKGERATLEDEQETLRCAIAYFSGDIPKSYRPSVYLNGRVRIIDCGDADKVYRQQSLCTTFIAFFERCHRAPEVARCVLDRAKARDAIIGPEKREAEASIPTKIDDLRALPECDRQPWTTSTSG